MNNLCEGCKRSNDRNGMLTCSLRNKRYCGETGDHFSKRVNVKVTGATLDPQHAHLEWPVQFSPDVVLECQYRKE